VRALARSRSETTDVFEVRRIVLAVSSSQELSQLDRGRRGPASQRHLKRPASQ